MIRKSQHLTFLDAYTQNDKDSGKEAENEIHKGYGYLEGYPDHYAEHYVDRNLASTDACLWSAFNFDITGWNYNTYKGSGIDAINGHQWPRYWYEQSVTTPRSSLTLGFAFGYPLSFEGGDNTYTTLSGDYPNHLQCRLIDLSTKCSRPVQTDPTYQCWP
jgi:hypothetical protein